MGFLPIGLRIISSSSNRSNSSSNSSSSSSSSNSSSSNSSNSNSNTSSNTSSSRETEKGDTRWMAHRFSRWFWTSFECYQRKGCAIRSIQSSSNQLAAAATRKRPTPPNSSVVGAAAETNQRQRHLTENHCIHRWAQTLPFLTVYGLGFRA